MHQSNNKITEDFEKEMWLYLDGDLPASRMKFWNSRLENNKSLRLFFDDQKSLLEIYNNSNYVKLDNDKFNQMIEIALNKNSIWQRIKTSFPKIFTNENEFVFGKIAFGSAILIAAILFSLFSQNPNPVKNSINQEMLDWDGKYFDEEMNKIKSLLKLTKDVDYNKYVNNRMKAEEISKNIHLIEININKLKEEFKNQEL